MASYGCINVPSHRTKSYGRYFVTINSIYAIYMKYLYYYICNIRTHSWLHLFLHVPVSTYVLLDIYLQDVENPLFSLVVR